MAGSKAITKSYYYCNTMLKTIRWHLGFCNEKYLPTHRGFESHIGYMLGHEDYYLHTNAPSGMSCQEKGDETQRNLKQLFSLSVGGGKPGYDFRRNDAPDLEAKGRFPYDVC